MPSCSRVVSVAFSPEDVQAASPQTQKMTEKHQFQGQNRFEVSKNNDERLESSFSHLKKNKSELPKVRSTGAVALKFSGSSKR